MQLNRSLFHESDFANVAKTKRASVVMRAQHRNEAIEKTSITGGEIAVI